MKCYDKIWGNHVWVVVCGILTADAVDHERIQLLLAMLALPRQVRDGLHLTVEQVVQQRKRHLLWRAAITADVQHVCLRHGTAHTHLRVIFIPEPCSCRVIFCSDTHKHTRRANNHNQGNCFFLYMVRQAKHSRCFKYIRKTKCFPPCKKMCFLETKKDSTKLPQ